MRPHYKPGKKDPRLACAAKGTYRSTREARRTAQKRLEARTAERLFIYWCDTCKGYHLSKQKGFTTLEEVTA